MTATDAHEPSDRLLSVLEQCLADPAADPASVCGGDAELLARLRTALAAMNRFTVTEPTADPPPAVPGFELLGEVGRGGMGVVYRARDLTLGRDVAVKLLGPRGSGGRRFRAEAAVTGQLQHPGIPAVYQMGTAADGRPFLALKLVKGDTLAALLKAGADRGRLVAVFEGVCQAVAYAHSRGVIHRDLKPANVMVGAFGEVQVMDWGLAKVLTPVSREAESSEPGADESAATVIQSHRDDSDHTQDGQAMGTPGYMPPEQAIGSVGEMDRRSDVFGLGAVLCHVLTGQPPYVGADAVSTRALAARAKLDDAFGRLGGCGAEPELVALCKRCLSAERADRPVDAGEVATAIAALRQAADARARRAEVDRGRAEVRRRLQRRLGGLAAAVLVAGAVGVGVQWQRAERALVAVSAQERATETALTEAHGERERAEGALTRLTAEQQQTQAALEREEATASATRASLLGWLRQRADSDSRRLSESATRERTVAELRQLRDLLAGSVERMPPGRERTRYHAEVAKLSGDIINNGGGLHASLRPDETVARAAEDYATAARLSRELLADEPESVAVRRLLADCLMAASEKGSKVFDWPCPPPRPDLRSAAAVAGGLAVGAAARLSDQNPYTPVERLRESIRLRRSVLTTADPADHELLAAAYAALARHLLPSPESQSPQARMAAYFALRAEGSLYDELQGRGAAANLGRVWDDRLSDRRTDCLIRQAEFLLDVAGDWRAGLRAVASADAASDRAAPARVNQTLLRVTGRLLAAAGDHQRLFPLAGRLQAATVNDSYIVWEPKASWGAAELMARCVSLARADPSLAVGEQASVSARYADACFAALAAVSSRTLPWRDGTTDPVFAPLHSDPRWKALPFRPEVPGGERLTRFLLSDLSRGREEAAARMADHYLSRGYVRTPSGYYDLACVFAVVAEKHPVRRLECLTKSMTTLRKAVSAGFVDAAYMAADPDLAPLRDRLDFKWLLAKVRARKPPEPAPPPRPA